MSIEHQIMAAAFHDELEKLAARDGGLFQRIFGSKAAPRPSITMPTQDAVRASNKADLQRRADALQKKVQTRYDLEQAGLSSASTRAQELRSTRRGW